MDYPSLLLPPPTPQQQPSPFGHTDDRKRFITPNPDLLPHFAAPPTGSSPFLSSLFSMNAPPIPPPPLISSSRRSGLHSDSSKSSSSLSLFPPPPSNPFDFTRSPLLPHGMPPPHLPNNPFESDRYRFLLEQQAREREFQLAMMAAATPGGAPPPPHPPLFTDPNSSALFKHF